MGCSSGLPCPFGEPSKKNASGISTIPSGSASGAAAEATALTVLAKPALEVTLGVAAGSAADTVTEPVALAVAPVGACSELQAATAMKARTLARRAMQAFHPGPSRREENCRR